MQAKALQLSSGRKSNARIKNYLHNEFAHNKFLSINDYKAMTKQVQELRDLESAYLSESLVDKSGTAFASAIDGSSSLSQLQLQQLNQRVHAYRK